MAFPSRFPKDKDDYIIEDISLKEQNRLASDATLEFRIEDDSRNDTIILCDATAPNGETYKYLVASYATYDDYSTSLFAQYTNSEKVYACWQRICTPHSANSADGGTGPHGMISGRGGTGKVFSPAEIVFILSKLSG